MPNHCDNWIRISGPEETLQMFESQPFDLELGDPLPEEMREETRPGAARRAPVDSSDWIQAHWGTRWIAPLGDHHADLYLKRARDGSLQAQFISAWAPPLPFYNRLAEKYPSVTIEYEYTEWGVGFCGYGVGSPGGTPTHYNFETREDMRALNDMRQWTLRIWNPHYMDDENGQPMDVR